MANPFLPVVDVVWFKRDLRVTDHAPLWHAGQQANVLPLYVIEPELWLQADASNRHWAFIKGALIDCREALKQLGQALVVREGDICDVFDELSQIVKINAVHAHQETGNLWSYQRDIKAAQYFKARDIAFHEYRQQGVLRGPMDRNDWADRWDQFMAEQLIPTPEKIGSIDIPHGDIPETAPGHPNAFVLREMNPSRQGAEKTLARFLHEKSAYYPARIGQPGARFASSRLSAHLAWGTLSVREVVHAIHQTLADDRTEERQHFGLQQFKSRLYWHCHFIQKLESEPNIEIEELNPAFCGLRGGKDDEHRLKAWQLGKTGWPLVDACMRSLIATGWLNFRMRALLVSVASNQLWLPWQLTAPYLAKLFVDYEPGIHYPQIQMQSGTTGINQLRMYNPIKQSQDNDPKGEFIKRYILELRFVPAQWIHTPWLLPLNLQRKYGVILDRDYPRPIVDHKAAAQFAKEQVYRIKRSPEAKRFNKGIVEKHASRRRTSRMRESGPKPQMELF
jgi:deoxyribodipyrimidine photo-lyase